MLDIIFADIRTDDDINLGAFKDVIAFLAPKGRFVMRILTV